MPYVGVRAELTKRIEAIIEIGQLMVKKGHNPKLIQETLIDPIIDALSMRIEHGPGPEEGKQ